MPRGAQYALTDDGVRIAFVTAGRGRALFWLPHFLASHVELEWEFPQRFVYAALSKRCQVIRFDGRGLGLSDRDVVDLSPEARMKDLTAVADKLDLREFDLVGVQGGGNLAVAYAARFPQRVGRLVLLNWSSNFRDDEASTARMRSIATLLENDWDMLTENVGGVSFGYKSPLATGYGRLVRASATQEMAIRYGYQLLGEDCYPLLEAIQAPALVLHSERSSYASASSARTASIGLSNSRLRAFEGDLPDHIESVISAILEFVAPVSTDEAPLDAPPAKLHQMTATAESNPLLTPRETEILRLIARGLTNREVANELVLSPRTIERHLENVYRKTGAKNRTQAAALAFGTGSG